MDRIEELSNRLATLERSARRHRLISVALGCALLATIAVAATAQRDIPDVLQTRRLEIIDPSGQLVLAADASERGGQLDIWNDHGQNVVRIATNEFGGDWIMWNAGGATAISAYATEAGSDLMMWHGDGTIALTAQGGSDGGRIDVHSATGAAYFNVAAREELTGLVLRNHEGKPAVRVQAAAGPAGGASASLLNDAGEPMILSRAMAHGGEFFVSNAAGRRVVGAAAGREGGEGSLTIADAEGRSRFAASGLGRTHWSDGEGKAVARAGAIGEEGRGAFDVLNASGQAVASLGATDQGEGRINVANDGGDSVFSAEAVPNAGGAIGVANHRGARVFAVASREQGGLLNMMNAHGVPILMMGYADETRGGGFSIRNGRGIRIFNAGTGDDEHGEVRLWDADGRRMRLLRPIE